MGNAHSEAGGSGSAAPGSGATGAPTNHHAFANVEGAVCPVKHDSPVHKAMLGKGAAAGGSAGEAGKASSPRFQGPVYNVYSQEIDPKNMMPAPNQAPAAGQQQPLSTQRVQSTIPKGGTEGSWLYPSPQMFWNSLVRKGKADGVAENDIDMVVAIHNEMNERTWGQLLQWESSHKSEHLDGEPALRRFQGNPWSPSPKARMKSSLGFGWPFDRHDWYVDRGGKQVHYVIDYYFNSAGAAVGAGEIESGKLKYTTMIHVDVRPAVDSVSSFADRVLGFPSRAWVALSRPKYLAEGLDPANAPKDEAAVAAAKHASDSAVPVKPAVAAPAAPPPANKWEDAEVRCRPLLASLAGAKDDEERRANSVALNYCMARVLCPSLASNFMNILESNTAAGTAGLSGGREEEAFEAMTGCVIKEMQAKPRQLAQYAGGAQQPQLQ